MQRFLGACALIVGLFSIASADVLKQYDTSTTGTIQPASVCVGNQPCVVDVNSVSTSSGSLVVQSTGSTAGIGVLRVENFAGTELFRIQQDGNVGIGTTIPATLLDVAGATQFGSGTAKSTFSATGNLTIPQSAVLYVSSGNVGVPGLAINGDTNTGIYSRTADEISFTAGGTEIARAGSNVFTMGSTASSRLIHEGGNVRFRYIYLTEANPRFEWDSAAGLQLCNGGTTTCPAAGVAIRKNADEDIMRLQTSNGSIQVDRVVIDGSGNVGVGTSSPAQKLHVSSGTILVDGNATNSLQIGVSSLTLTSAGNLSVSLGSVTANAFFGDGSALTGISSYFSKAAADISPTTITDTLTVSTLTVGRRANGAAIFRVAYDENSYTAINYNSLDTYNNAMRLQANAVTDLNLVLGGGKVGVATASPCSTCTVHIIGNIAVTGNLACSSRTKAQLEAETPTDVGQCHYCTDCSNSIHMVVSTGSAVSQYDSFTGGTAWH